MKNYVRNILIFVVTFSLVFGLCIVPSYAFNDTNIYDVLYLSSTPSTSVYSEGTTYANINGRYLNVFKNTENVDFYFFLYKSGNYYIPCICYDINVSLTSSDTVTLYYYSGSSPSGSILTSSNFTSNSNYNLRTCSFSTGQFTNNWTRFAPVFDTYDLGCAAIRDYIDNGVGGNPSSDYTNTYGLLNGYAIVFDLGSANQPYDIFVTQLQSHSSTGQFNNVKQTWGWSDNLPDTSTTFPRSSDTIIPFYKTGSDNIWGASNNGFSNKATMVANGFWNETSNSRYLTIYNPYAIPIEQSLRNGAGLQFYYPETLNITITGAISYKLISLRSSMTNTGVQGGYTSDENDTVTEDIGDSGVLNPEIDGKLPEKGGQNENPDDLNPIQSITGYLQNIQQTLSDFANSFISLLQAPISHVRQLISAGSEYFGVIRGLYGWLPDEVQGTINSAMIVSISVGVIALLL